MNNPNSLQPPFTNLYLTSGQVSQYDAQYPWLSADQTVSSVGQTIAPVQVQYKSDQTATYVTPQSLSVDGASMTGAANGNIVADLNGDIDAKIGNQVSAVTNANVNRSIEHEFTQRCVQALLDVNKEIIRILIEYQEHNWVNENEFTLYKMRLQSNLSYLATVADQYSHPQGGAKTKTEPDFSLLPQSKSANPMRLNALLQRAAQIYAQFKAIQNTAGPSVPSSNPPETASDPTSLQQFKAANGQHNGAAQVQLPQRNPRLQQQLQSQMQSQQPRQQPTKQQLSSQSHLSPQHLPAQQQQLSPSQSTQRIQSLLPTVMSANFTSPSVINSVIPDYATMTTVADNSYQGLPSLVGMNNVPSFTSSNTQVQNMAFPSLLGMNDTFNAQQLQQLQNMGFNGYIGGNNSISGNGFVNPSNVYGVMRYGNNGFGNGLMASNAMAGGTVTNLNGNGIIQNIGNGGNAMGNGLGLQGMINQDGSV
ncbi:9363_t:CDS:2 [Paraglomus occultum]|uniref:9363_t:CDS:1 n=1 Tax=Paraglomus occultum TaxID=144539 RepID=A0A9N8WL54_9GLOM|nr:9363_t:CDS:2 [Paraglomus occultum]